MSAFGDLASMRPLKIWDAVIARAVEGEHVSLAVVELEANSVVPEHSHENEQLGLVLQGTLRFQIGDEVRELGPGETWSIPSSTPHGVETGPEGAVVIDVFAPKRSDWRDLESVAARSPLWP